jgi:hypothetical protein
MDDPREGRSLNRVFLEFALREKAFLAFLGVGFLAVGIFYENAEIARWLGFLFAGYAVVGNDSIQTIGTFIASNRTVAWWAMWAWIGGIFLVTVGYSFLANDGDVTFQRLSSKGFSETPMDFSFLQVAAPLILLVLTRLRMPVSTTFLVLTSFATSAGSVGKVLAKSISGYFLAFAIAFVAWMLVSRAMKRWSHRPAHPGWRIAQWCTTGLLWSVWLMQDAANVAVYLPRSLSWVEFVAFASVIFFGLGLLFYFGGEKIQEVVDEKSDVVDVRAATMIDFIYTIILFIFKIYSKVPMSTTWVFIGLLGGRELAIAVRKAGARSLKEALIVMTKDVVLVTIGLLISLVIAAAVNDGFRATLLSWVGLA